MNFPPTKKRASSALIWIGIFLAAIVLVVLAGLAAYRSEVGRVAVAQDAMLAAIGELKSRQIEAWRRDRAFDAWRLAQGKFLRGAIGRLSDPAVAGELGDHLSLQSAPGDGNVLVFSPEGSLLLSTREDSHNTSLPMEPALKRAIAEALAKKEAVVSELYRRPAGRLHIDFAAAVTGPSGEPAGVLVLRSFPEDFLQPLLKDWPLPSETAETLLVARDGDEVVFLNSLRHRPDAALNLRFPMSRTNLPPVKWLLGHPDAREGVDYRGEPVLAHVTAVKDSPWIMEAKVDKKETFRNLPAYLPNILLVAVVVLLSAAVIAALVFIQRQRRDERSLRASEERFRSYIENAPVGIFMIDGRGVFSDVNSAAERMSGFTRDELIGKSNADLVFPDDLPVAKAAMERLVANGKAEGEMRHVTKDGRVRYWQVKTVASGDDRYLGFVSDVHDRHIAREEAEVSRRRAEALLRLPEASPVPFALNDSDGGITCLNAAFTKTFGYSLEDIPTLECLSGLQQVFRGASRAGLPGRCDREVGLRSRMDPRGIRRIHRGRPVRDGCAPAQAAHYRKPARSGRKNDLARHQQGAAYRRRRPCLGRAGDFRGHHRPQASGEKSSRGAGPRRGRQPCEGGIPCGDRPRVADPAQRRAWLRRTPVLHRAECRADGIFADDPGQRPPSAPGRQRHPRFLQH